MKVGVVKTLPVLTVPPLVGEIDDSSYIDLCPASVVTRSMVANKNLSLHNGNFDLSSTFVADVFNKENSSPVLENVESKFELLMSN